jgi:hypothetical protein
VGVAMMEANMYEPVRHLVPRNMERDQLERSQYIRRRGRQVAFLEVTVSILHATIFSSIPDAESLIRNMEP